MDEDIQLIEMVEKFGSIWDKTHKDHKDENIVRNAWETIGTVMELSVDVCKSRWLNIPQKYVKESRTQKTLPTGSPPYIVTWKLFNLCKFLDKVIVYRRTKSNMVKKSKVSMTSDSESADVWNTMNSLVGIDDDTSNKFTDKTQDDELDIEGNYYLEEAEEKNIPDEPVASGSRSSLSDSKGKQKNFTTHKVSFKANINKGKRRIDKSDDIKTLVQNCTDLTKSFSNFVAAPTDNRDNIENLPDWHFAVDLSRSLENIKSKKTKLVVKSKILALAADYIEENSDN